MLCFHLKKYDYHLMLQVKLIATYQNCKGLCLGQGKSH